MIAVRRLAPLAAAVLALLGPHVPSAAEPMTGDPGRGLAFARSTCAACHVVEPGRNERKIAAATAFQAIARNPARTALSLRVFLRTPHRRMPDLTLTPEQTDDVIAYIRSLR